MRLMKAVNAFARVLVLLAVSFAFVPLLLNTNAEAVGTYLDPEFSAEILTELTDEFIVGGTLAIGPGGAWGDDVYVLTTPVFQTGTAPEIANVWKVNRITGAASVVATFPSRFDPDPAERARAFYTSGRIPSVGAVITGNLVFDSQNLFGPVDTHGNPGLYITSADSGKIYVVAPDGSIELIHDLRGAVGLLYWSDPTGIIFSPPGWQPGMYVAITDEVSPYYWKLVRYTSLSPLSFSIVTSGTEGCGVLGFAQTPSSPFGSDLYATSSAGFFHAKKISQLSTFTPFSDFFTLASFSGLTFSTPGPFDEALYVGYGKISGNISGSIFKILPDGTSTLFASEIGGAGMIFESAASLLTSAGSEIIRISINNPPACDLAQATPALLWSPNHKLVPVIIADVTDPDKDGVTITVLGVSQDEPLDGLGDGDTSPDAVLQDDTALLRAERSENGNGRVYQILFTADDGHGGTCTGSVQVGVPHSMKDNAIDDGQSYNSTQP